MKRFLSWYWSNLNTPVWQNDESFGTYMKRSGIARAKIFGTTMGVILGVEILFLLVFMTGRNWGLW